MQRNTRLMGIEEIEEDGHILKNEGGSSSGEEKKTGAENARTANFSFIKAAPDRLNLSTPLMMHPSSGGEGNGSSSPMSCFSSCSSSL
jgi:hypothetical protein